MAIPVGTRLKSTHRPLWRDARTVQLALGADRAVVITDLTAPTAQLLHALERGATGTADPELVALLARAGCLDAAAEPASYGRLTPERALLGLLHPSPSAADDILAARRARRVLVVGGGRVGAAVAHVLAASGLGRVTVQDVTPVREADACPAGNSGADVGLRRGSAATALVVRCAPPVLDAGRPDVAVLCPDGAAPPDPAVWRPLLESGSALLCATVREGVGVVGPWTPAYGRCCPGCISLHRADRDPAWPLVERQLADPDRAPASTAAAAAVLAVAAAAADQVLTALDAGVLPGPADPPDSLGCTLELPLPGWRWRRRRWGPHPECPCRDLHPPP